MPAPVDIWYTRCGGATASTIAIQQGFLDQAFDPAEVHLRSLREGDASQRESHYDHSIRSMFREGGNIPPIWARARGADTVVLGITWVDEFQSIVVRADSGIGTLADLAGKRLAVPNNAASSIDFQRGANLHGFANGLSIAGLTRNDVTFVDVVVDRSSGPSGTAQLKALDAGLVDAVFLRQTSGLKLAREYGGKLRELVRLTDAPDPAHRINNGTPRPITVHREFLDRHPGLVVRYLTVLIEAAIGAEANPDQAIAANAREDGQADAELIAATFPRLATSLRPRLTTDYVHGLTLQKEFLRDWGFLDTDFDVTGWIEREPLRHAEAAVRAQLAVAAE